jgi:hypothetical protein
MDNKHDSEKVDLIASLDILWWLCYFTYVIISVIIVGVIGYANDHRRSR